MKQVYLVGGAVRDNLLNLPVSERDWVVVGATPDDMLADGYTPVGKDFPVFLHPETKEEFALARTERKAGHGYTGFEIHANPDVTLEEDLLRRDLTVNAMAEDAEGALIDPYGGEEDLLKGLLRHVSPAFVEDPVRVLRVARFAARFAGQGFHVAHGTNALMRKMVASGEVDYLVPERVWAELHKALRTETPVRFFDVLHGCNALSELFPQLASCYADAIAHSERAERLPVLAAASALSPSPVVRFAALACDMQPQDGGLDELCDRYRVPNDYRQLAALVAQYRGQAHAIESASAADIMSLLESVDALRRSERVDDFLTACEADARATGLVTDAYRQAKRLQQALRVAQDTSVDTGGKSGPEIGAAIRAARVAAIGKVL